MTDNYANGFPHDVFTRARRECPVYWHPPTEHTPDCEGFWVVTRHADVMSVFRDPLTWFVALVRFRVTPITPQAAPRGHRRQLPGSAARA